MGAAADHPHSCHDPVRMTEVGCVFYKKYFKDVSREFDEFQVNTHLKLRCWYL